jgi:tRNA-Thr(GGU) m(6)t(6)A37 methyltransferase TsaA
MPEGFTARPIGRLRTPWATTGECPRNGRRADPPPLCTVEVDAEYQAGLLSIEGYSHLILLYWLDQSGPPEMVFTPPFDSVPRGIFATRTPRRPNPIGLSVVKLEAVIAPGVLQVRYLDCVDGTKLLDIKPYLRTTDCEPEATMGFQENRTR